jgi:hypothetical protein
MKGLLPIKRDIIRVMKAATDKQKPVFINPVVAAASDFYQSYSG